MKHLLLTTLLAAATTGLAAAPAGQMSFERHTMTAGQVKVTNSTKRAALKSETRHLAPGVDLTVANGMKKLRLSGDRARKNISPIVKAPQKATAPEGYVLFESFEGWDGQDVNWTPEGWTIQRSGNVEILESWSPSMADPYLPAPSDGKVYMGITYSSGQQDEWMISPVVEVAEGMQLSFWAYYEPFYLFAMDNFNYDTFDWDGERQTAATLQTWVKEEGGEWEMIHDLVDDWKDASAIDMMYATPTALQKISENIQAYWGKKIQVGFRYVGTDGNTMFIDAIGIGYPSLDGVSVIGPFDTLYWGFDKGWDMGYVSAIPQFPVYAPLTWQNYSDWNPDVTYSWTYVDPATGETVTSDEDPDMLTLSYEPDYTSAETMRNNLIDAPVLNATAQFAIPAQANPGYTYFQAGGKAEIVFKNGDTFDGSLLPFDYERLGLGYVSLTDYDKGIMSMPIFGYGPGVDEYWLDYALNGQAEASETDYCHLDGIANLFMPSADAPIVINGVYVNAYGEIDQDAELTMTIYGLDAEMANDPSTFTLMAQATLSGKDILRQYVDSKGYLCLPFSFDEPAVLMATSEHPAYFVLLEGFRSDKVSYFAPLQNMDPDVFAWGYMMTDTDLSSHGLEAQGPRFKQLVYKADGDYVDPYAAFAFGLVAEYPWLTTDCEGIELTKEAPEANVALGSYYDGSKLTVSAPTGVTATVAGRYNECVLSVSRDDSMVVVDGEITVSGPGVEVKIPVKGEAFSGIDGIIAPEAGAAAYYDLSGRRLKAAPATGVYFVRSTDGTVSKQIAK